MQAKPEFRKSERFGHEYIINFGDDGTLSPYYALSQNLSETGMHFKSLFELYPGRISLSELMTIHLSGIKSC